MTDARGNHGGAVRVPEAEELLALGSDPWGHLLVHARGALHDLDEDDLTAARTRLRAAPASRLAGGRVRQALCREISVGGALWRHLHRRLAADADLPEELEWLVTGEPGPRGGSARPDPTAEEDRQPPQDGLVARLRDRVREFRREREEAIRRAEGAQARSETLATKLDAAGEALARAQDRIDELETTVEELEDERRRAVERERRRADAELAELREEVRDLRRREQERQRLRQRAEQAEEAGRDGRRNEGTAGTTRSDAAVAGRPSELPHGVEPGTAAAVRALLTPGRRVIVDGYNVTLRHRDHVDLEQQRAWLLGLLRVAAARFRVRPVVVFDGGIGGSGRTGAPRGVRVRFSEEGLEADDEIAFLVAAAEVDEPLLVVTDDAGLRERLAEHDVDVVATGPFLWAVE